MWSAGWLFTVSYTISRLHGPMCLFKNRMLLKCKYDVVVNYQATIVNVRNHESRTIEA
jgi:hypothetical protein